MRRADQTGGVLEVVGLMALAPLVGLAFFGLAGYGAYRLTADQFASSPKRSGSVGAIKKRSKGRSKKRSR